MIENVTIEEYSSGRLGDDAESASMGLVSSSNSSLSSLKSYVTALKDGPFKERPDLRGRVVFCGYFTCGGD